MAAGGVRGDVTIGYDLDIQKFLNKHNRMLDAHAKELKMLKEKVRLARKGERISRKKGGGNFGLEGFARSLPSILGAASAITIIHRLMGEMSRMEIKAFQGLQTQEKTMKQFSQLGTQSGDIRLGPELQRIANVQAIRQSLNLERAGQLVFELQSRGLSRGEIRKFPSLEFATAPVKTAAFAADVQRQFGGAPQGAKGIEKIISGALVAAKESKVNLDTVISLIGRPSQFGQELGLGFKEQLALVSSVVSGTADPKEASTQMRALFSQLTGAGAGKSRGIVRTIKEEGIVAGLRFVQGMSERQFNNIFGTEVRAKAGIGFLSKERNIQQIERTLPLIGEAVRLGGTGGPGDPIAEQRRFLAADVKRQTLRVVKQGEIRESIAAQSTAAGLAQRAAIIKASDSILNEAFAEAGGVSKTGRFLRGTNAFFNAIREPALTATQIAGVKADQLEGFRGSIPDTKLDALIERMENLTFLLIEKEDRAPFVERVAGEALNAISEITGGIRGAIDKPANIGIGSTPIGNPRMTP